MTRESSQKQTLVLHLEQLLEDKGLNVALPSLQVDHLKSWMNTVESVLSAAGRVDAVENWRRARPHYLDFVNVRDHAKRMKILLQSIKSKVEQDGGEVALLANVGRHVLDDQQLFAPPDFQPGLARL